MIGDISLNLENEDDVQAEARTHRSGLVVFLTFSTKKIGLDINLGDADDAEAVANEILRAVGEARKGALVARMGRFR